MIKIGIFPTIKNKDNLYIKSYEYLERYLTPFINEGVKVVLLLGINKEYLIKELSHCDALLIPGGDIIDPLVYDALDYAYLNKLPVLGICMGMQAICVYSRLRNILNWSLEDIKKTEDFVVKKIGNDSHHKLKNKVGNLDEANIDIFIEPDSKIYKYFGKQVSSVKCFHDDCIMDIGNIRQLHKNFT